MKALTERQYNKAIEIFERDFKEHFGIASHLLDISWETNPDDFHWLFVIENGEFAGKYMAIYDLKKKKFEIVDR